MTMRYGVILAGGGSRRMGEIDKVSAQLAGKPLIAHVIERLAPQVEQVMIAASHDYGTGLPIIADDPAFKGPAAGILGAAEWMSREGGTGFVMVPADGPFLPLDLAERLSSTGKASAIAADEMGLHPTFAYWRTGDLARIRDELPEAPSLRRLVDLSGAKTVHWDARDAFFNINTPEELTAAEKKLAASATD
ncbi:MAG: molybdenum cofactor guanylyltransferase [Pseudomonadota bacterium]